MWKKSAARVVSHQLRHPAVDQARIDKRCRDWRDKGAIVIDRAGRQGRGAGAERLAARNRGTRENPSPTHRSYQLRRISQLRTKSNLKTSRDLSDYLRDDGDCIILDQARGIRAAHHLFWDRIPPPVPPRRARDTSTASTRTSWIRWSSKTSRDAEARRSCGLRRRR